MCLNQPPIWHRANIGAARAAEAHLIWFGVINNIRRGTKAHILARRGASYAWFAVSLQYLTAVLDGTRRARTVVQQQLSLRRYTSTAWPSSPPAGLGKSILLPLPHLSLTSTRHISSRGAYDAAEPRATPFYTGWLGARQRTRTGMLLLFFSRGRDARLPSQCASISFVAANHPPPGPLGRGRASCRSTMPC